MNINIETFLMQCAAMGVWVFLCAGMYAILEKFVRTHWPHVLELEAEGASQPPSPIVDTPKQP